MARKRKRLTDDERAIVEQTAQRDWFTEDTKWFKEQVEAKKATISMELVEEVEKEAMARADKDGMFHLKDVCKILDWEFPRDKEQRTRLALFANQLQINQQADSARMLWNGMKAVLTREKVENPTDIFVSKKEARKGRKRAKAEAINGVRQIRIPRTDVEKKTARKERAQIRKEAKKLGITPAEYRTRMVKPNPEPELSKTEIPSADELENPEDTPQFKRAAKRRLRREKRKAREAAE